MSYHILLRGSHDFMWFERVHSDPEHACVLFAMKVLVNVARGFIAMRKLHYLWYDRILGLSAKLRGSNFGGTQLI